MDIATNNPAPFMIRLTGDLIFYVLASACTASTRTAEQVFSGRYQTYAWADGRLPMVCTDSNQEIYDAVWMCR